MQQHFTYDIWVHIFRRSSPEHYMTYPLPASQILCGALFALYIIARRCTRTCCMRVSSKGLECTIQCRGHMKPAVVAFVRPLRDSSFPVCNNAILYYLDALSRLGSNAGGVADIPAADDIYTFRGYHYHRIVVQRPHSPNPPQCPCIW